MYKIEINEKLFKKLQKIPRRDYEKIREKLLELQKNPRPRWIEKLQNRPCYRLAVGNYRILYDIDDHKIIIFVIDIDDRKNVYKRP